MAITAELDLQISAFQQALNQASASLNSFAAQGQSVGGATAGGISTGIASGAGAIASALGTAVLAGVAAASYAAGQLLIGGVQRAMAAETMEMSFSVLIGDDKRARQTLDELRQLGAETPFEFPELADAGRKLIAFGEDAGNVTNALRRIGDVSSGVGAPIGEVAEIYGKARVAGKLFAEDINQLLGRGIPVMGEFAKILGVSEGQVKKLASEGKLTFPMLEQAFKNLTDKGGKFAGMMAAQSGTVAGLVSTLSDSWGTLLLELGRPVNDAIRPLLKEAIEMVEGLKATATAIGNVIGEMIRRVTAIVQAINFQDVAMLIFTSLTMAFKKAANVFSETFIGPALAAGFGLGQLLIEAAKGMGVIFTVFTTTAFWQGLGNALMSMAQLFGAKMLEGVAMALKLAKSLPGAALLIGATDQAAAEGANILREKAKANAETVDFSNFFDLVRERFVEGSKNIRDGIEKGFKSAPKFDTTMEEQLQGNIQKRIADQYKKNAEEAKKEERVGGPPEKTLATGGAGFALNGNLAGAINSIMGRSTNELLASSMQAVQAGVEQTNKTLEKIEKNTAPKNDTGAKLKPAGQAAGVFQ